MTRNVILSDIPKRDLVKMKFFEKKKNQSNFRWRFKSQKGLETFLKKNESPKLYIVAIGNDNVVALK